MDETKVREIHNAKDLSQYTHDELLKADAWVKAYAIKQLRHKLNAPPALRSFVLIMARAHYGSVETDTFLRAMECYPEWVT